MTPISEGSPRYGNAPVFEAVVEISTDRLSSDMLNSLETIGDSLRNDYPVKIVRSQLVAQITGIAGSRVDATASQESDGFLFRSSDGKQLFQLYLGGFSSHRLPPYEGWDSFCAEAHRLWEIVSSNFDNHKVNYVGTRFINQIIFPTGTDIGDYLRVYPLTDALSPYFNSYNMQVAIDLNDMAGGTLHVSQAVIAPDDFQSVKILIDIQLQFNRDMSLALWEQISRLRDPKNKYFEACLTQKMKELLR